MSIVDQSIRNPLLANLSLVLVVVIGILSWQSMPQEMFPVVELDKVRIATVFPGASPEEVERQVTLPIEQAFDGKADIDVISSSSSEGISNVLIEFKSGADIDDFLREARDIVDRIDGLPEEAERSRITRVKTRFPVISVALYGDVGRATLQDEAEALRRRILSIPGVAGIGMAGDRDWEIWVEVDPERLAARSVPLSAVVAALRNNLRDLPGGSIRAREGDILLRGRGTPVDPEHIAALPIVVNEAGGRLRLGEVARVGRRLEEALTLARFNGQPSINMTITKTAEASTIAVADAVRRLVGTLPASLPPTIHADVYSDLSRYVRTRLNTVQSSGLVGLALVLLSLYLFLNFRVALITALGIPVSFLFASILLYETGYTINMVSLFAFLIVLGMIVDDAIIVTENIYRHMELGLPRAEAARRGASEVFWPVVASTLTTIAAFLPMFAVGGTMGAFIAVIPVVVIFALVGSLLEAFVILPSHACDFLRIRSDRERHSRFFRRALEVYLKVMRRLLVHRYLVTAGTVAGLVVVVAFAATRLPFELFGEFDTGQFFINIEAPNTYSLEDSRRLSLEVEAAIHEVLEDDELDSMLTNIGVTFIDFNTIEFESNEIQLIVDLKRRRPEGFIERWITPVVSLSFRRDGVRRRSTAEVIDAIRRRLQSVPGIQRLAIQRPRGGPAGADVEVAVSGPDIERLRGYGEELVALLRGMPGVADVRQDLEPGKLEYRYALNDRGRELGLDQARLAEAVRIGFQGLDVVQVNDGNRFIPVRVLYPESVRERTEALRRLRIVLDDGRTVFLSDVADIEIARGPSIVKRRDLERLVTVTAEVDSDVTTPGAVTDRIQQVFGARLAGLDDYDLVFLGQKRAAKRSIVDMLRALVIALALIFFILAALFKSLLDPIVVMFAIPFGIIGIVFGHALLGYHLQFLSLIGFLALSGIVVNDSLILVDFAKKLRAGGAERFEAMIEACRVRVRPILLTSITTFLGISPLIFFSTGQTAFLAPMAVSLGFGLLFATVLILVAIPCFSLIADDLRQRLLRWRSRLVPGAPEAGGAA